MKLTSKRIVLLVPGFPDAGKDDSAVTYLQDLALSFRKVYPGCEVRVITFHYPYREGEYEWNGINVYSAGGSNRKWLGKLLAWRRVMKKLRQWHREARLDVVHSFWLGECTFIGQRFCRKHKVKLVASSLGQDIGGKNRYFSRLKFDKMKVVAISDFLADRFEKAAGRKVNAVVPFGLDPQKLNPGPAGYPAATRDIDVAGAGSLIPLKNYGLFIDIIHALKKDFPSIKAIVAGEGGERTALQRRIAELELSGNVLLAGDLLHREVFQTMCRSKVFLHTSSYEGQSLVMLEALYAGLPVVCFDTARPYNGPKMHVCGTKEEMVKTIRELLKSDPDFEAVLVQTTEQTTRKYLEIYSQ